MGRDVIRIEERFECDVCILASGISTGPES